MMPRLLPTRLLPIGLLLLGTVLAGPAMAQEPPAAGGNVASGIGLPPLSALEATRDRPLFAPSRRPPDPVEAPEPEEAEPTPVAAKDWQYDLNGIVMGPGVSVAVLKHRESNETRRLLPGEEIEAWQVQEITPRALVLKKRGKTMRMELFAAASASAKPAAAKSEDDEGDDSSSDSSANENSSSESSSEMSSDSESDSESESDTGTKEGPNEGSAKPFRPGMRALPHPVPPPPSRSQLDQQRAAMMAQRTKFLQQRPPLVQRPQTGSTPLPTRQR